MHNSKTVTKEAIGGEQPIDVAHTILALANDTLKNTNYLHKMETSFSWFLW
jgi:hypothetical protein